MADSPRSPGAVATPEGRADELRADRRVAWLLLSVLALGVLLAPLTVPVVDMITRAAAPQELQWIPPALAFGITAVVVALRPSLRAHLARSTELIRSTSPVERRMHWIGLVVSVFVFVGLILVDSLVPELWRELLAGLRIDAGVVAGFFAAMLIVLMPPPRPSSSSHAPPP